jgi:septal ring factor EnvC (AmiA/AmiB activator)
VASGRIEWLGSLAGRMALLIDHGADGVVSVLVGIAGPRVAAGQLVAAGQTVAEASGADLYLEIRLRTGAFGHPIDPAPLLGP